MSPYAPDSRDRVRDAVDMLALVGARVDLTRRGVDSYFGVCPFHDERTGSFHVRPDEKHYHCFGCQASGDAFDFVMETEGLGFREALEALAERFGVELQTVDEDPDAGRRREQRSRLGQLLDRAATFYARSLWESAEAEPAREYLRGRGLDEATLRDFRVGYAPGAWDRILQGSTRAGFSVDELVEVGLVRRSDRSRRGAYDFFREQIVFPAASAQGRIQGFGARRMRDDQPVAKYVNTPDGPLYHKREILFGIDRARRAAARAQTMYLVEGYTDVLALHQAGVENAVGIMGTSFTDDQLAELRRVVSSLQLCLDADSAGQEAVLRAAALAERQKVELRVVVLPEGRDPADIALADGPDGLRERIATSVPFASFKVDRVLGRADTDTSEGRGRAIRELAPVLSELDRGVLRDDLLRRVAGRLGMSEAQLVRELSEAPGRVVAADGGGSGVGTHGATNGDGSRRHGATASAAVTPGERGERLFLALCIAVPDAGETTLAEPEADLLVTSDLLRRAARHLRTRVRTPLADLPDDDEPFARAIAGLVELAGRVPQPGPDRLEHARLVLELERLERRIRRARVEGEGTTELARERETARAAYREVVARLEGTT